MQGNVALELSVLMAWSPVVVVLFRLLGRRRGTLAAVLGGYLLLPPVVLRMPGFFHFMAIDKDVAIGLALTFAILIWDARTLFRFRPSPLDVPMLALVAWGLVTSLLGQYVEWDVAGGIFRQRAWRLVPYIAARLYLSDTDGARRIAIGFVVASLALVPVVIFESLMGPSWYLRTRIYGFPATEGMSNRLGGWRPEAFFDHGIGMASWLALSAVLALWLWRGHSWRPRWGPAWGPTLALVLATLATRGVYAYINLIVGVLLVLLTLSFRSRAMIVALALLSPLYMGLRISEIWDGQSLVTMAGKTGRASTVAVRIDCEDRMIGAVLDHNPAFGFGRPLGIAWGDKLVQIDPAADGAWLVYLWVGGLIGLSVWLVALHLWPVALALIHPGERPRAEEVGNPVWGLALSLALHLLDSLHNNPVFSPATLAAGSIIGLTLGGPVAWTWAGQPQQVRKASRVSRRGKRSQDEMTTSSIVEDETIMADRHIGRDLLRLVAVLAVLAIPEILGKLMGKGTGPPAAHAPGEFPPVKLEAIQTERRSINPIAAPVK